MSLFRNTILFLKGIHEYTREGFEAASTHFVDGDLDVSVAGRSFMITGANSGIGKATAIAIARRGGTIHMVCRNWERAEKAKEDICRETENKEVYVHILDLSQTQKVWAFTESFKRRYRSLNVLINNAGCMISHREVNSQGFEKNFATNTLGVYILTKGLLPLLERSSKPRVITVSAGDMLVQKLRATDLQSENGPFDGPVVYAQCKRQQVVMTEKWAKLHSGVHFASAHPGWADTPAVAATMPRFHRLMQGRLRSAAQGADTVVWLAVSKAALSAPSGLYFQDRLPVPTHLPLAWTRSHPEEEQEFMTRLDELAKSSKPPSPSRFSLVKMPSEHFVTKPSF